MEQNILLQKRYRIISNSILVDNFLHQDLNMINRMNIVSEHIKSINSIDNLCIIDKLIYHSCYGRMFGIYIDNFYKSTLFTENNRILLLNSIKEDLINLDLNLVMQLYGYYTLKNVVNLFLKLLNEFIEMNINNLQDINIKNSIALIMEVFQPTKDNGDQKINYNGAIRCAVALNIAKS